MAGIDEYTKLMLHMDGADGSTTFTDSEITPKAITANGNAQIDTAQSVFGGASGLFDGNGDYLTTPDSADFDFGTGDFTIDGRVRLSANTNQVYYCHGTSDTTYAILWRDFDNTRWAFIVYSGNSLIASATKSGAISLNTWYHLAIVRNGNDFTLYVDGVGGTTNTHAITYPNYTQSVAVGAWFYDGTYRGRPVNGHIDELRVSKGIARWTANFTPPTEAYSAPITFIPNIMLLGVG